MKIHVVLVLLLRFVVVNRRRCKQEYNISMGRQLNLLFDWDAPATLYHEYNHRNINASLAFMGLWGLQQVSNLSAFSCKLCSNDPLRLRSADSGLSPAKSVLSLG